MTVLIVQDMQGNQAPLEVTALHITQQLNTLEQIEFTTFNTPDNNAFNMIQPRSIFIDPQTNEIYRIEQRQGQEQGDLYQLQVTALQILTDLSDHYVNNSLHDTQSLDSCMKLITDGTKFNYTIHGNFNNHDFGSDANNNNETFGNALAYDLFINSVVKDYNVEWIAHGYHIDLYNQIGSNNSFVSLDKSDIYALQEQSDFTTLKTRISGVGKVDDNSKKPVVSATYTSPNAKQFGIIDAASYSDDRCTDYNTLLSELKAQLQDYPLVQYQADINKFKQYTSGLNNNYEIGNYGIIRTRWGIDETVRISKLDKYIDSPSNADVVTFGNLQLDPSKIMAQLQSSHNSFEQAINQLKNENSSSNIPITPLQTTIDATGKATGTITLAVNNNVVTTNFSLKNAIVETIVQLPKTYTPSDNRSGVLNVNNGLLSYEITKDGKFNITKITDLTGKAITTLASVSGSFNYIL